MSIGSKMNPLLTLEYVQTENENKYFDRKSGKIRVADLAPHISAFANADGGTIVIGVSDKKRALEGVNSCGEDKISEFINAPKDCCRPMPRYREEFIGIINEAGQPDRVLLLHIEPSVDQVIRTSNDRTYLRIGDKSKEMLGENLRNKDGKEYLTNAAVLLFVRNIMKFNMNCRIRFIRVDGREMQVGANYNVVKDKSIDEPILRLVDAAKAFITDQLRVFTRQEHGSGRFVERPEYPEFPWVEGIINAVAHRDYAALGQFIKVSMYDDRLEIESPGRLPYIVTPDNISYTRFSRNKTISRVMTEFEWVRELNEGVKKIYSDMTEAGLPAPEFVETPNTVKLILRNNIDERTSYRNRNSGEALNETFDGMGNIGEQLNDAERQILKILRDNGTSNRAGLVDVTGKSVRTVSRILNRLVELGVVRINGNKYSKNHTYSINEK